MSEKVSEGKETASRGAEPDERGTGVKDDTRNGDCEEGLWRMTG